MARYFSLPLLLVALLMVCSVIPSALGAEKKSDERKTNAKAKVSPKPKKI
uniref:Agouti signaling protein n=1 Tax=Haemonchus contortus TaxID=6289 RepID=A0A7I5ECI9_HAECO